MSYYRYSYICIPFAFVHNYERALRLRTGVQTIRLLSPVEIMGAPAAGPHGVALSPRAAAEAVAALRLLPMADFGSDAWWAQRRQLERLNAACHSAAATAVAEALAASPTALDVLVQSLLVTEGWRQRVAPHLGTLVCRACVQR